MNYMGLKRQVKQYKPKSRGMKLYRIREGTTNVNGEIGKLLNSLVLVVAQGTRINETS